MPTFTGQIGTADSRPLYLWPGVAPATTVSFSGTATFSGSGTLGVTTTPKPAVTISLAGAGTVTPAGTPAFPVSSSLSGSGTLSATGTPKPVVTLSLNGVGSLTALATITGTGVFTGSGTLSVTATPKPVVTVSLAGAGTLAASESAMSTSGTAGLSGTGNLGSTGIPGVILPFRTNLAINPELDTVSTGWAASGPGTNTYARQTGSGISFADAYAQVITDGTAALQGISYSVTPSPTPAIGVPYSVRLSARRDSASDLAVDLWLRITYTDASTDNGTAIHATLTANWQEFVSNYVIANATKVVSSFTVFIRTTSAAIGTLGVTALLIEQAAIPGGYFSGDTAPDLASIRAWAGTANASASTETKPTYKTVGGATFSRVNGNQLLLPHRNGITQMAYAP